MNVLLRILLPMTLVGSVGCKEMRSISAKSALDSVNSGKAISVDVPSCLVDYEEFQMDVKLNSFEIYSKKGFEFGYNLGSGLMKLLGLGFKTEKGLMTMYMGLSESINPTDWVSYVEGNAKLKKKDFRFNVGINDFSGGMNYFKQTPMSKLTGKVIVDGLANLQAELERKGVLWRTRVVHNDEVAGKIVIPVGAVAGLEAGDLFNVYNVNYIWKDQPCESELLVPAKTTTEPLAVVQAVQVENNATILRVIEKNFDDKVELGAMVEINLLKGDQNRRLSRPVRIRNLSAEPLPIEGSKGLDLKNYLNEQSRAFMDLYGFQPRN